MDAVYEITLNEAMEYVRLQVQRAKRGKTPSTIMLWGKPGIGKTEGCQQIAQEEDIKFIPFNLALRDPTDIKGLGKVSDDGYTQWSKEETFFPKDGKHRLVLIDDFTIASPTLQAASQEIINNRQVGGRIIDPEVILVMAGNYEGDMSYTSQMPASTSNRPLHLFITPKADDWIMWASKHNVHPIILSFIHTYNHLLYGEPKPSAPWPSPRSWYRMHRDHVEYWECKGVEGLYTQFKEELVHGRVGGETSVKFMNIVKDKILMDLIARIKDGKVSPKDEEIFNLSQPQQFATVMAVVQTMPVVKACDWLIDMKTQFDDIPQVGIHHLLFRESGAIDQIYKGDQLYRINDRFGKLFAADMFGGVIR